MCVCRKRGERRECRCDSLALLCRFVLRFALCCVAFGFALGVVAGLCAPPLLFPAICVVCCCAVPSNVPRRSLRYLVSVVVLSVVSCSCSCCYAVLVRHAKRQSCSEHNQPPYLSAQIQNETFSSPRLQNVNHYRAFLGRDPKVPGRFSKQS